MNAPKSPFAADVEIGKRIATLRTARGMSQTALGAKLGVSFQQVQKYETGRNRVSAGRVQEIAAMFGVAVHELYAAPPAESHAAAMEDPEIVQLVGAFGSLGAQQRGIVLALVRGMAGFS
jgi:transcriptional regulator with XRE-family HTH domain